MTNEVQHTSDDIDLRELFTAIWKGQWIIATVTIIFTLAAVIYSLSLPNIYKSEALLAPVSEDAGLKIPGQLGGLAALAGVNLGGLGSGDKTVLAIEVMKTREFLGRFIEKHDLFLPIMAAEGWNSATNELIFDPAIYDIEGKKWTREVDAPFTPKPSIQETHEEFMKVFSISQDKINGLVKVSVEHYSPHIAKHLVDELLIDINNEMRNRDLVQAQRSISYLNTQIEQTNISDVRVMLYSLIEEQTKTLMLANVRDEYIFKTVDPAVVAEKKHGPKRLLIVVFAFILGLILGATVALIRFFIKK